jgi:hypothetical protein
LNKKKDVDIVKSERLSPSGEWVDSRKLYQKLERYIPLEKGIKLNVSKDPYDYFINCEGAGEEPLFAETRGVLKVYQPSLNPFSAFVILENSDFKNDDTLNLSKSKIGSSVDKSSRSIPLNANITQNSNP